ncbi:AAA family ATPase [Furfurilactobacillus entadae]|uniref:AAA family ATPase n=1 Tax=Furfurilactobacillus entadae TaxID=2922307 RepID=UPI0035EDCE61
MTAPLTKQRTTYTPAERAMIWHKLTTHVMSAQERRIVATVSATWDQPELRIINLLLEGDAGSGKTQLAKALSADFQLPYTKITCFADMDKTDVLGALLPVLDGDTAIQEIFERATTRTDLLNQLGEHLGLTPAATQQYLDQYEQQHQTVHYQFYPSEIVRAVQHGYLLEIQEPTVIRDASVLVALNAVLEPNGTLETLQGQIPRHPDTVVVLTTNRHYQGNRPLNESLRDRMQYSEKMDLPTIPVMVARAQAKTTATTTAALTIMAEIIRLLDETATANGIRGVAGMRSYLYWAASASFTDLLTGFDQLVLYKITTDETELALLHDALAASGLWTDLQAIVHPTAATGPSTPQTVTDKQPLTQAPTASSATTAPASSARHR